MTMGCRSNLILESSEAEDREIAEKDPTGRYIRYDEILGKGAFKTVYKAFDQVDGIEVAWNQVEIDDVMQSSQQLEILYSEVHLLKSLKHENIIKFYNYWIDDRNKTVNIITELFTSGSLRQYRSKHKNVDMKAIKNWARQILRGLSNLHAHNPLIIHRDLKCDNIFVNGNTGEVKIGDLGLAAVMHQPTAHSVIGTPEFMAPELYDEDYNELVDIYSFGMCILELVTCEYPYSECKNSCQIYKKVTSGIKPAALNKVMDPQVKQFIEKCLVPASLRLPASELLKDPFLATGNSKALRSGSSRSLNPHFESVNPPLLGSHPMHIDPNCSKLSVSMSSSTKRINEVAHLSYLELQRLTDTKELKLKGKMTDHDTISFDLRRAQQCGKAKNIHFDFYLESDTASAIAVEMVEQLELSNEDATTIAELIDELVTKLVPNRKHSASMSASVAEEGKSKTNPPFFSEPEVPSSMAAASQPLLHSIEVEDHDNQQTVISCVIPEYNHSTDSDGSVGRGSEFDDCSHRSDKYLSEVIESAVDRSVSVADFANQSQVSCSGMSNVPSFSSFSSLSLEENDHFDELKLEIDAIEQHYHQCLLELSRMREEAIGNVKKKMLSKKASAH